ncbi:MAG: porin family protein [Sebaldella sp.]|nr:porin family protein [Sebaldella sp.]
MKKYLIVLGMLLSLTSFAEGNKVEVRGGIDLGQEFNHNYNNLKKDADFSYELAVEYRREVIKNVELGVGLAYQDHGKVKTGNYNGYSTEGDLYDSIPLYLTGRYTFKNSSEFTPYVKANIGYSFNINDGTLKEKGVYGEVDYDVNAKDGFYYGLGLGVEYKGFIADLSYQVNYSDIEDRNNSYLNSSKADFQRVTLGLGYNFGF